MNAWSDTETTNPEPIASKLWKIPAHSRGRHCQFHVPNVSINTMTDVVPAPMRPVGSTEDQRDYREHGNWMGCPCPFRPRVAWYICRS